MSKKIKLIWELNPHYHSLFIGLGYILKWGFYFLVAIAILKLIFVGHLGRIE